MMTLMVSSAGNGTIKIVWKSSQLHSHHDQSDSHAMHQLTLRRASSICGYACDSKGERRFHRSGCAMLPAARPQVKNILVANRKTRHWRCSAALVVR